MRVLSNNQDVEGLLARDHRSLDFLLQEVIAAFDDNNASGVLARLDLLWARLAMHIRAENLHLFSVTLKAIDNSEGVDETEVREVIERLQIDHDFFMNKLATAVKLMRKSIAEDVQTAAESLEPVRRIVSEVVTRLETHNQLEEELVYGLPAKLLAPNEVSELAASIRHELEKLPPRFAKGGEFTST